MHMALYQLGSLSMRQHHELEQAVDELRTEAEFGYPDQASRAEALAILAHEFRRRSEERNVE